MLAKLKTFLQSPVALIPAALAMILAVAFVNTRDQQVYRPASVKDFTKVTVKITSKDEKSGGSGSILKSEAKQTFILTNKHICHLVQNGGFVIHEGKKYLIRQTKPYPKHDLCLIRIAVNLKTNLAVAKQAPDKYSAATISGHPKLFPSVVTNGHFSDRVPIQIVVDFKKCDRNTPPEYHIYCFFMGGIPVIKEFDSQLVTATILPGSSGSAVFNGKGELSGVAFASASRELAYAFIVPHKFVVHFLKNQNKYPWYDLKPSKNKDRFFKSLFVYIDYCDTHKRVCGDSVQQSIWRD